MTTEITRKRKRLSKNKKKSWRKTDINDVEEYLEDVRLQERTGGVVSEKQDDQLFFVDKDVTEEVGEEVPVKKRRQPKPLRCHALLEPDPKVKPVKVSVPRPQRKSIRIVSTDPGKKPNPVVVEAERQRALAVSRRKEKRANRNVLPVADHDLWGEETKPVGKTQPDEFFMKYTKKARVKVPKTFNQKPSEVAAVEVPHGGQSYNPTYTDHQELLQSALDVEVKKIKDELKLKRALDDKFPSLAEAPTQATWLSEMSAGLCDKETGHDSQEFTEEELLRVSLNPAVRREDKKTERQRRKDKEKKEKEKELTQLKKDNVKKNEFYRLKSIKKEVKQQEMELQHRVEAKAARKLRAKDDPKKLGKLKYEKPSIPLKLSDELEGSLRLLKPEGHLLEDRFKSLQKRNIIEPRKRAKVVRKYKPKKVEKRGHKQIKI